VLFNTNAAIVQLYYGENKLVFNEMMMRSTLYDTNTLSLILVLLAEPTVRKHVAPPGHIVLIPS
jgi:hypothetical protein